MAYRDYADVDFRRAALVPLMPADVLQVREFCDQVQLIARANGQKNRYSWDPTPDEERQRVLVGFLGELALAKFMAVPYEFALGYDPARYDVAGHEVRSTQRFNGCLITHETDKPAIYVLALVHRISYYKFDVVLAGWIDLLDANTPNHWRTDVRHPAFFTPQTVLHPMGTLRPHTTKATVGTWHFN